MKINKFSTERTKFTTDALQSCQQVLIHKSENLLFFYTEKTLL